MDHPDYENEDNAYQYSDEDDVVNYGNMAVPPKPGKLSGLFGKKRILLGILILVGGAWFWMKGGHDDGTSSTAQKKTAKFAHISAENISADEQSAEAHLSSNIKSGSKKAKAEQNAANKSSTVADSAAADDAKIKAEQEQVAKQAKLDAAKAEKLEQQKQAEADRVAQKQAEAEKQAEVEQAAQKQAQADAQAKKTDGSDVESGSKSSKQGKSTHAKADKRTNKASKKSMASANNISKAQFDKLVRTLQKEFNEQDRQLDSNEQVLKAIESHLYTMGQAVGRLSEGNDMLVARLRQQMQEEINKKEEQEQLARKISYYIRAIIPGRAWLRGSDGNSLSVSNGDEIPGYGLVTDINAEQGYLVTSKKDTIRFGISND